MQKEYNKHTKIKEKNHTQARLWHKMNKKKEKEPFAQSHRFSYLRTYIIKHKQV